MDNSNQNINSEYEALKASKFKQQKLPAWRPVPSICVTITIFLSFGVIFLIIGGIVLHFSNQIYEKEMEYPEKCFDGNKPVNCTLDFTLPADFSTNQQIMFYYKLTNFYQNHRRYVKSKSNEQLLGKDYTTVAKVESDCSPVIYNKDIKADLRNWKDTKIVLPPNDVAYPCGLIAKSFFNDTYTMTDKDKKAIEIDQKKIAWPADLDLKYALPKPIKKDGKDVENPIIKTMWIDTTDEHFVVWMRPAGLPNFRKLWGRIQAKELKAGEKYTINIQNNYPLDIFNGKKYIVISTVNAFGGKNTFLAISYLVVGGICILMAFGFFVGDRIQKNKTS